MSCGAGVFVFIILDVNVGLNLTHYAIEVR